MSKLIKYGIYTNEDNVRVIVEEINEELSFFDFPMYYFSGVNRVMTKDYINKEIGLLMIGLPTDDAFIRIQDKRLVNMNDYGFLGEIDNGITKKRMKYAIEEFKSYD